MKKNSGFTLIELIITVSIAAILLALGTPAMKSIIQNGRITQINNELVSAIHVSRSEAVRRGSSACLCASADVTAATPTCSGNPEWETGWIAFLDNNADCVFNAGNADNLLKVWDGTDYQSQVTVRVDDLTISGSNTILFNSRGEPVRNNIIQQGTFSVCDDRGVQLDPNNNSITASAVILSPSGSARSTRSSVHVACP